MHYQIRQALPEDKNILCALLPRLAAFDVPDGRNPDDLWLGDEQTLLKWFAGDAPNILVHVATSNAPTSGNGEILGLTMVSLREELLSHEPSAHLEAIVVTDAAAGQGIGKALMANAEEKAWAAGAKSMSLHVFSNNHRARHLYARTGYDEELIRCYKRLNPT